MDRRTVLALTGAAGSLALAIGIVGIVSLVFAVILAIVRSKSVV